MITSYSQVRDAVYSNPLLLSKFSHAKFKKYAESFLPSDTGLEFEVAFKKDNTFDSMQTRFTSKVDKSLIRNIEYDFSRDIGGYPEKRFRIKKGIVGMVQLFNISKFLKLNAFLNDSSIIHIHVGLNNSEYYVYKKTVGADFYWMSDIDLKRRIKFFERFMSYVPHFDVRIKYLNFTSQNFFGTNKSYRLVFRENFKTIEIRTIPLSFNYSDLIRSVIICHKLVHLTK